MFSLNFLSFIRSKFHVAQAGFEFIMYFKMILDFASPLLLHKMQPVESPYVEK